MSQFEVTRLAEDGSRCWHIKEGEFQERCINRESLQFRIANLRQAGASTEKEESALAEMNRRRSELDRTYHEPEWWNWYTQRT